LDFGLLNSSEAKEVLKAIFCFSEAEERKGRENCLPGRVKAGQGLLADFLVC